MVLSRHFESMHKFEYSQYNPVRLLNIWQIKISGKIYKSENIKKEK